MDLLTFLKDYLITEEITFTIIEFGFWSPTDGLTDGIHVDHLSFTTEKLIIDQSMVNSYIISLSIMRSNILHVYHSNFNYVYNYY